MAHAKSRLAEEYETAQDKGEVVGAHNGARKRIPAENSIATVTDIGLTRKQMHEGRLIRDAELIEPGIVRRTLQAAIAAGEEPTKATVKRAAVKAVKDAKTGYHCEDENGATSPRGAARSPPGRHQMALRLGDACSRVLGASTVHRPERLYGQSLETIFDCICRRACRRDSVFPGCNHCPRCRGA